MVASCWAPGCTNRLKKGSEEIRMFRFPHSDPERLTKWLIAIKRICGPGQTTSRKDGFCEPTIHSRMCSAHFVKGSPSLDAMNIDYIPTIFQNTSKAKKHPETQKRKQARHDRYEERKQKQQKLNTGLTLLSLGAQKLDTAHTLLSLGAQVVDGTNTETGTQTLSVDR